MKQESFAIRSNLEFRELWTLLAIRWMHECSKDTEKNHSDISNLFTCQYKLEQKLRIKHDFKIDANNKINYFYQNINTVASLKFAKSYSFTHFIQF